MPEPASIAKLLEQPAPSRVVVLGKGPSLDRYDPDAHGDYTVFAVNEAVNAKPFGKPVHVDYWLYLDKVMADSFHGFCLPDGCKIIRSRGKSPQLGGYWFFCGEDLPKRAGGGSIPKVICILGEWARRHLRQPMEIVIVGCDAWDNQGTWTDETMYAKCLPEIVGGRNKSYASANMHLGKQIVEYAEYVRIRWFHRELLVIDEARGRVVAGCPHFRE